jgi:beta-glucosidase
MCWGATVFPQAIGVASGWNPDLTQRMAAAIRAQMRAIGAHQGLAPLLDVCRDPRWGRMEETFGEDPYLVSSLGCAYVRGIQGGDSPDGCVATGKHFVGYGNAEGGMNWAPAKLPPRELHEVFLAPFEAAVRQAKLGSIMNSYGELDGIPCCASRRLFLDILRDEWGFDGIVVSDYWAIPMLGEYHHVTGSKRESAARALTAGIDVDLPTTTCYGRELEAALGAGEIGLEEIERAARAVLVTKFRLGLFESAQTDAARVGEAFDAQIADDLALRVARESIVLLKNDGVLPIAPKIRSIALIGPTADDWRNMIGDYSYPSHVESLAEMKEDNVFGMPVPEDLGDASSSLAIPTILEALRKECGDKVRITCVRGCEIAGEGGDGIPDAVRAASGADMAILVLGDRAGLTKGCTSGESRDVAGLRLPGQQERLLREVQAVGKPVVVILLSGRPYVFGAMLDHIDALVCAWFPGQAGGRAIAEVLSGGINPSGKLPVSWPRSAGQLPLYHYHTPSGGRSHWTGDYVDQEATPLYPFGHGLGYSPFEYSDCSIRPDAGAADRPCVIGFTLRNAGERAGTEVAQLYIGYRPEGSLITRPLRQLKGFVRVALEPGEGARVELTLHPESLAFHDEDMALRLYSGDLRVMIGSSSRDIRLEAMFRLALENRVEISASDRKIFCESSIRK